MGEEVGVRVVGTSSSSSQWLTWPTAYGNELHKEKQIY